MIQLIFSNVINLIDPPDPRLGCSMFFCMFHSIYGPKAWRRADSGLDFVELLERALPMGELFSYI